MIRRSRARIAAEPGLAVTQHHEYSTRLTIDTGAELVEVTAKGGKPIDQEGK